MRNLRRCLAVLCGLCLLAMPTALGEALPDNWAEDYVPAVQNLWPSLAQDTGFEPIAIGPDEVLLKLRGANRPTGVVEAEVRQALEEIGLPVEDAATIVQTGGGGPLYEGAPVGGEPSDIHIVRYGSEQSSISYIFLRKEGEGWQLTDAVRDMHDLTFVSDMNRTNTWLVGRAYGSGTGFWVETLTWYNLHTRKMELGYVVDGHDSWEGSHFGVVRTTDDRIATWGDRSLPRTLDASGYLVLRRYVSAVEAPSDAVPRELDAFCEVSIYQYDAADYRLKPVKTLRVDDMSYATLEWISAEELLKK